MVLLTRPGAPYPHRRSRLRRAWSALLAAWLLLGTGLASRTQEPMEYLVKGVYLFKFGDYVEWPAESLPKPGMPFVIGILGDDPFGAALDQAVKGRTIQGRPILLRRLARVEEARDVHILYIGASEARRWEHVLSGLQGRSVLTVSDGSLQPGAVINFVIQGNKVRFEINADAADRVDLKLSSKLMSLATEVRRVKTKGEG